MQSLENEDKKHEVYVVNLDMSMDDFKMAPNS